MAVSVAYLWTHPAEVKRRRLRDEERQAWLKALSEFLGRAPSGEPWEIR